MSKGEVRKKRRRIFILTLTVVLVMASIVAYSIISGFIKSKGESELEIESRSFDSLNFSSSVIPILPINYNTYLLKICEKTFIVDPYNLDLDQLKIREINVVLLTRPSFFSLKAIEGIVEKWNAKIIVYKSFSYIVSTVPLDNRVELDIGESVSLNGAEIELIGVKGTAGQLGYIISCGEVSIFWGASIEPSYPYQYVGQNYTLNAAFIPVIQLSDVHTVDNWLKNPSLLVLIPRTAGERNDAERVMSQSSIELKVPEILKISIYTIKG